MYMQPGINICFSALARVAMHRSRLFLLLEHITESGEIYLTMEHVLVDSLIWDNNS